MATVIDSFTFRSTSSSNNIRMSLHSSPPAPSPPPPPSAILRRSSLPSCTGLKFQRSPSAFVSLSSFRNSNRASRRGGAIVCEASDTALDVPSVTDSTWKSLVLEADSPVMVEFWASWCGPCRMILPVIAELSKHYAGRLKCYKLNTDECPTIATQYGIRSIPTIMIFVNGEKRDAVIGAVPKSTLTACIEKFL